MTELIFVYPGMKVNGQYNRDVLLSLSLSLSLSQRMLPTIKHVAGDTFVFQQDNAPSHRDKDVIVVVVVVEACPLLSCHWRGSLAAPY